ncbi:MAG: exosortase A [Pseudomonadota bacterium]
MSTTSFRKFVQPGSLLIALALLAPFAIYISTLHSMVDVWNSSETFAHGYIIFPISLWLIWKRRATLGEMTPAPCLPALFGLALCGLAWLLAELGDVQVVRQYAFVAMVPVTVIAVLGWPIARALAFPLVFLLLAVPFGEAFIDPLINFTADFTVAAVRATGIPVLRNGSSFEIPTGSWSVVEACSGVRYLISSVTLGCLYAYLTYRSRLRQFLFLLVSIIVPIVANGLRAFMIVMIGHLSGMKLAVGVDHIIYGWIFFGLVMFLMLWIGSYWREDLEPGAPVEPAPAQPQQRAAASTMATRVGATIATIACLAMWPFAAQYLVQAGFNPATPTLANFNSDWTNANAFANWKPAFLPANAELYRFYQHDKATVGLSVLYYRNQQRGAELISTVNRMVAEKDRRWQNVSAVSRQENVAGHTLGLRESRLQGADGPLLAWQWYWIDGRFTANKYLGKLLQAKEKFLMHGDDGAAVTVFAPYLVNPEEARASMRQFLGSNLAPLQSAIASNKKP